MEKDDYSLFGVAAHFLFLSLVSILFFQFFLSQPWERERQTLLQTTFLSLPFRLPYSPVLLFQRKFPHQSTTRTNKWPNYLLLPTRFISPWPNQKVLMANSKTRTSSSKSINEIMSRRRPICFPKNRVSPKSALYNRPAEKKKQTGHINAGRALVTLTRSSRQECGRCHIICGRALLLLPTFIWYLRSFDTAGLFSLSLVCVSEYISNWLPELWRVYIKPSARR